MNEHCWHVPEMQLDATLDAVYPVTCCWCGLEGGMKIEAGAIPDGHGQFAPPVKVRRYDDSSLCEKRP